MLYSTLRSILYIMFRHNTYTINIFSEGCRLSVFIYIKMSKKSVSKGFLITTSKFKIKINPCVSPYHKIILTITKKNCEISPHHHQRQTQHDYHHAHLKKHSPAASLRPPPPLHRRSPLSPPPTTGGTSGTTCAKPARHQHT